MFEEQKLLKAKFNTLCEARDKLDNEINNIQEQFILSVSSLVGKCYSQPDTTCTYYTRTANNNYSEVVSSLDNIIQIIGIKENKFIIQQAKECVNKVAPRNRLTWKLEIFEYDIEKFISYNRNEISIEEYLNRLKEMQKRDSYDYWHTTINIK